MDCFNPSFFALAATKIRGFYAECSQFFCKKSAKVSPLNESSTAVWDEECDSIEQLPTDSKPAIGPFDDTIQPMEVIVEQPVAHEEHKDDPAEVQLPALETQVIAIYQCNTPDEICSDTSAQAPIEFSAAKEEVLPLLTIDDEVYDEHVKVPASIFGDCTGLSKPWIIDVCWETCNPYSGIYYEIQAKAGYNASSRRYAILGPYNDASAPNEFQEMDLPPNHPFTIAISLMRDAGYRVLLGKWLVLGSPITILFDVIEAQEVLDQCLEVIENNVSVDVEDTLTTNGIVFGFMTAKFLDILNSVLQKQTVADDILRVNVIAHFHEWISATGLMMMKVGNFAKGVATAYTDHESPFSSYNRTECTLDWVQHRDAIDYFAQGAADLFIGRLPEHGDEIDSMYNEAITTCRNTLVTLYFDIVWTINYDTYMTVQECASYEDFTGRYFVLAPVFDEANLPNIIDEVELPVESPLSVAVAALKRYNYKVIVGKLKIPGQPFVLLFDVMDARDRVFERVSWHLRDFDKEALSNLYTDDNVFQYLVSVFFSNLNNEMFRKEVKTGQKTPKHIRIYGEMDDTQDFNE